MKMKSFFKLLNRKIKKYDKAVSNPFEPIPLTITLVWVEDNSVNFEDIKRPDLN